MLLGRSTVRVFLALVVLVACAVLFSDLFTPLASSTIKLVFPPPAHLPAGRLSPFAPVLPSLATVSSWSPACDVCAPDDAICRSIGEHNLARSVVTRGSGLRLRRFLRKLMRGKPVTIAVLGGSISNGHGLYYSTETSADKDKPVFGRLLFEHLSHLFPNQGHVFHSGAVPGRGSAYFVYCSDLHLPPNPDLILTEHNVNDVRGLAAQDSYDALLRSILNLPSKPAVLNVQSLALFQPSMIMGGDTALAVAAFYDVPTVSLSQTLLPILIKDPSARETYYLRPSGEGLDTRHMNKNGHEFLAHLLRIFIEREMCRLAGEPEELATMDDSQLAPFPVPAKDDFDAVPRLGFTQKYDAEQAVQGSIPTYHCLSSAVKPSALVPDISNGWDTWVDPASAKTFLRAASVGATMTFANRRFETGEVILGYLSSAFLEFGDTKCSLKRTDREGIQFKDVLLAGTHTQSNPLPITVSQSKVLWKDVGPGTYDITCTLQRPKGVTADVEFRMFSLITA